MKNNFNDVTIKDLLNCYMQIHPELKGSYDEFLKDERIDSDSPLLNSPAYKMLRKMQILENIHYDYTTDDMPVLRELLMYAMDYMITNRDYVEEIFLENHDKKIAYFYSIAQNPLLDLPVDDILANLETYEQSNDDK